MSSSSVSTSNKSANDGCVCNGLICIYESFRPDCGYRSQGEMLCLRTTICLECCCGNYDIEPRIVGFDFNPLGNGEFCKLGCYCCDCTIIQPRILCGSSQQVLCMQASASLPFHEDYMNEPVCAYLCLQCVPRCGCAAAPPGCPVLYNRDIFAQPTTSIDPMDRGTGGNYIPANPKTELRPMTITDEDLL